jgi:hypothetical protein
VVPAKTSIEEEIGFPVKKSPFEETTKCFSDERSLPHILLRKASSLSPPFTLSQPLKALFCSSLLSYSKRRACFFKDMYNY